MVEMMRVFVDNIPFYKDQCIEWQNKKTSLLKHLDDIKTLSLGGSHILYGVNPHCFDDVCFNFGLSSIDLFGMWNLLNIYGEKLTNLQNVIVRIGLFIPSHELIKTGEAWRCFYYRDIFGIPYDIDGKNEEYTEWKQNISDVLGDLYLGYKEQTWFGKWLATERYEGHLKGFLRNDSQLKYLSLINEWCVKHKKRLICVLAPTRSDVQDVSSKSVINLLCNYVREYAPYAELVNLFYDSDFTDDDFGDTDHLNKFGADKFSIKLNEIIKNDKIDNRKNYLYRYLFIGFIINLPFVRPFVKYDYILKIRDKIKNNWC